MIEDERSLISVSEFKHIFFMYFKGEQKAVVIYEKLFPYIKCYLCNEEVVEIEPQAVNGVVPKYEMMVSIQKLAKFIDVFNYYPIQVNSLRAKNDSDELTFIMTSNTRGSLKEQENRKEQQHVDEKHLMDLLQIISAKLYERFKNLRTAFRYLDTNHSQSISLNEFS